MPFQSTQKTTEDVDNGHSKEGRLFDVDLHSNTFKIRFRAVYTQAYGGAYAHAGAIAPGTRSCQTRTPSTFFFGPRKRGFVRTLRTPLGYVPGWGCQANFPLSVVRPDGCDTPAAWLAWARTPALACWLKTNLQCRVMSVMGERDVWFSYWTTLEDGWERKTGRSRKRGE